jgi:dienelactone hydrolase
MPPVSALGLLALALAAPAAESGTFRFEPVGDQSGIPERFRLAAREFPYAMSVKYDLPASELTVYRVTFPSPVTTPTPENNTVHAEYYRPHGDGPFPAVIVLDITAGDQSLSRGIAAYFAHRKIAALFVQMAYYGPRRPPGSKLRLMSPDIPHTIKAVTQTVLDCRVAAAWLVSRPEVDAKRLGILGTSLGSFVAALTGEMEPRLGRVVILLGGGGLVDAYWNHPQVLPIRTAYELLGGSKQRVKSLLAPIDPITCAANLKGRKVLMVAASRDEIVPAAAAAALWEAMGKPHILWYDTTHYGAALYLLAVLGPVEQHVSGE